MKKTFQAIYHGLKSVPIIGPLTEHTWTWYKGSSLNARRLQRRDVAYARELTHRLFGEKGVAFLEEFIASDLFNRGYSYGHSGDFDVMFLYTVVRVTQPAVVLETGVASGRSSSAILSALVKNNHGTLYSIDLPQYYKEQPDTYRTHEGNNELTGFVPEGKTPGWLVPDPLRERWKLILGDAKTELTQLLSSLDTVDIFYHDSDHSEAHMQFEFEHVFPKIAPKGFLLSDDVRWNNAWSNFMKNSNLDEIAVYRNFGIARKKG